MTAAERTRGFASAAHPSCGWLAAVRRERTTPLRTSVRFSVCQPWVGSGLSRTSAVLPANLNGSSTVARSEPRGAAHDPSATYAVHNSPPQSGRSSSYRGPAMVASHQSAHRGRRHTRGLRRVARLRPFEVTTSGASRASHWPAVPAGARWRPVAIAGKGPTPSRPSLLRHNPHHLAKLRAANADVTW
jgi:hypothetical protein